MIFNNEQLKARARELGMTHELLGRRTKSTTLWATFQSDMKSLRSFAEELLEQRAQCVQPAEDWLLDHMSFLEAQAQSVLRKLPRTTLHQLPKLKDSGLPRIYAVCEDYLEHVSGHYEVNSFRLYLEAYQEISVFKLIECWALPVAMSVVIVGQLANSMDEVRHQHKVCKSTATVLHHVSRDGLTDSKIRQVLERETRGRNLSVAEIVHFLRHLSELEPDIHVVREWLAAYVENSETSLEHMVSYEHELQAKLQVTCGNLVQSLHVLEREPWRLSFTKISHVEQIFAEEVTGEYPKLDFASQDTLRQQVERIAKRLQVPETLVAQTAVDLASEKRIERGCERGDCQRDAMFAYYVWEPQGIVQLRRKLTTVTRPRPLPTMPLQRRPLSVYFASMSLIFVALIIIATSLIGEGEHLGRWALLAVIVALILPMWEWAVTLNHAAIGKACKSRTLLRYDFSTGLPDAARTMVVMPIIWSSIEEVDDVINRLLVHYFANRQKNIYFAILADYRDARTPTEKDDEKIVRHANQRILELQSKYGKDRFFLFHRERSFNSVDKTYMGWERKRGKLVEFVQLLGGDQQTSFSTIVGDTTVFSSIRYVFTVDHDTRLPIGVASRLAGTMHFPFNRPRMNPSRTRVNEGYGILQPRIGVGMESTQKSRFAALWAGDPGIDPYAFAASNVYQDLFGRGIFVGKGLFDVNVFRQVLANRIPDNQVLSHDLLEGGLLRAGLTSDIEVIEEHPATFYAYEWRAHRWIRGDWQILRWLGRWCEDREGNKSRNELCGMTRWQIVDNLRRSLTEPALFVIGLLSLVILPGRAWVMGALLVLTLYLPFLDALGQWFTKSGAFRTVGVTLMQSTFKLSTLPFVTVLVGDAVLRTLYRVFISHRRMLQWVTSAQTNRRTFKGRVFVYEPLGYVLILCVAVFSYLTGSWDRRIIAGVLVLLWLGARPLVQILNHPVRITRRDWLNDAKADLESTAKQIWSFYEHYVTADDSWLPPDNVQYHPEEIIAHRTSPTNIGLYVASLVAAYDLQLIESNGLLVRLGRTVTSLEKMEKWHGHFFNWYDTQSLDPLHPRYISTVDSGNLVAYLLVVRQALDDERLGEDTLQERRRLSSRIDALIEETRFEKLFNHNDRLFCLGFHVDANRRETVLYDLLASEARQASFVAIALGQIPVSHWFSLGRTMTLVNGRKTLLSWSGTMFEYFMPSLIMRTYPNTVWDHSFSGVVARQQAYAKQHSIPFGISESGYYAFDYNMNYQYRAFGVPGLGFDRGLEQNLVAAPYATILSLPQSGALGIHALQQFAKLGARGEYGYYEAVDFTGKRLPSDSSYKIIESFMAHHQGMSLLTVANLLVGDSLIRRFHSDPRVQAAELLLQERTPRKAALIAKPLGIQAQPPEFRDNSSEATRVFGNETQFPEINVLANDSMSSVTTNDGNTRLSWRGRTVTRWHEDATANSSGPIVYLRNPVSEESWSATGFPYWNLKHRRVVFELGKSVYQGSYGDIASMLEITVCSDLDAEVRRLTLFNHGNTDCRLEATSFLELALASQAADSAHPAFSKLFVQTSHDAANQCLLAKRRSREEDEGSIWAGHRMVAGANSIGDYEFETDRSAFIGRGNSLCTPQGLRKHLRQTVGSVADPAFVMRCLLHLPPGTSTSVYMVTALGDTKEKVLHALQQLQEPAQIDYAFHLSWVRNQIDLRHLHLSADEAKVANMLAARLLYNAPLSRTRREAIEKNSLGQSALWAKGIGGDLPILTIRVKSLADIPLITTIARQHQYLCSRGLIADFVVLDETDSVYRDELLHRLHDELARRGITNPIHLVGLKANQLKDAEQNLLFAISRILLRAGGPSLRAQLASEPEQITVPDPVKDFTRDHAHSKSFKYFHAEGEFFNGWGSFVEAGKAYRISVHQQLPLPRPWTNVIANPWFGCILTELGTGYTWWRNSREFKLTPWNNDPVLDVPGECLYLRDFTSDSIWSAAPKPMGGNRHYTVTHRFGATTVEQHDGDITSIMETFVPLEDSLKVIRLKLNNTTEHLHKIAITYYAEWVLGVAREETNPYVVTKWDVEDRVLLATNTYQETFRDANAFLTLFVENQTNHLEQADYSWTGNRSTFIGRDRSLENPQALSKTRLGGQVGTAHDSCGAVQIVVDIAPGAEETVVVLLGCAESQAQAIDMVRKYQRKGWCENTRSAVDEFWEEQTEAVQVHTPDRSMDVLLNGWLLYQALACRLWARTAFYQAGGAFGFRDQLQDALALLHTNSNLTRRQLLIHAAHQYQAGDVQHWWHEETAKGIRTRFSDDLLWLPYATLRYIEHTGDIGVLEEVAPFLESDELEPDELERYEDTVESSEQAPLLEHCLRAVRHSLQFGEHGLPLMGIGDWNDGMNRVGAHGRGESVWLGWFLIYILKQFTSLETNVIDDGQMEDFRETIAGLESCINKSAWDGAWFRRAFTDDGVWLGSIENSECRIDAIAQSWSVIARGTQKNQQEQAMASFDRELVDRDLRIAHLLTKPFDETRPSPGYIQGYPPGIRENGGQYTHGVIWSIVAFAMLSKGDMAYELFDILNPISHTQNEHDVLTFGNEPYVMSADVYTASPHQGHAGWSWYTGAAGWMYQAGLEYILGVTRRGDRLYIQPQVPNHWEEFTVRYRFGQTTYFIEVECDGKDTEPVVEMDGNEQASPWVQLSDDGFDHKVRVLQRSSHSTSKSDQNGSRRVSN